MKVSNHGKWYWRPGYLGWSVACCLVWGVIWILVAALASTNTVHKLDYIFLGWAIGLFMASIASCLPSAEADPVHLGPSRTGLEGLGERPFALTTTHGRQGANPGRPVRPPALIVLLTSA